MLQSIARGSQTYEIITDSKKGTKEKFTVDFGITTVPESVMIQIRKDPMFTAMVKKKKYKELKPADVKKAAKAKEKEESEGREIESLKKDWETKTQSIIEDHEKVLKTQKIGYENDLQEVRELKAIAELKLKDLEPEKELAEGQLAKANLEIENLKKEVEPLLSRVKDLEEKLEAEQGEHLKTTKGFTTEKEDFTKKIEDLESEKTELVKQVDSLKKEKTELKAKLKAK